MSKLHHAELKDLQANWNSVSANETFANRSFVRPSGKPMTGVDLTYLACFRKSAPGAERRHWKNS